MSATANSIEQILQFLTTKAPGVTMLLLIGGFIWSANRLDGFAGRLDRIENVELKNLRIDVVRIDGDVQRLKEDMKEVKSDVKEMKGDISDLKTDIAEIKAILLKRYP